ncbi:MAG: PGPGW domain-containing protein [Acidobacteriota bacterium]
MSGFVHQAALTIRHVKRVIVITAGFIVLFVGIAMLVLPGPAFIVIPLGLGILATELAWARRLMDRLKGTFKKMREKAMKKKHNASSRR